MSLNDKIIKIIEERKQVSTRQIETILKKQGVDKNKRTIQRHVIKLYEKGALQVDNYNPRTKEVKYSLKPKVEHTGNIQTFQTNPKWKVSK